MKKFPSVIPVFPLSGVIYFPKTNLPLNIFEKRYLDLVNDTYSKDKFMGMVQSQKDGENLYKVGCLGKISDLQKTKDGRILINLTGITRFKILEEINNDKLYREFKVDYKNFETDLKNYTSEFNTEELMAETLEDEPKDWYNINPVYLQTQVSAQQTKIAFLVELNLSTVIRLTDFYRDVTYNSESYEAGGSFLSVDSTTETGQLEVNEINLLFSNVTDQVRSLVQDGAFTGVKVEIYIAYFDVNEDLVGAVNYFTGNIRNVSIQETIEDTTLSMTVASHWANWNLTKGRHYSDESQQSVYSGDRGLEYATQTKSDVRWGS